jgi:hypothetical protein
MGQSLKSMLALRLASLFAGLPLFLFICAVVFSENSAFAEVEQVHSRQSVGVESVVISGRLTASDVPYSLAMECRSLSAEEQIKFWDGSEFVHRVDATSSPSCLLNKMSLTINGKPWKIPLEAYQKLSDIDVFSAAVLWRTEGSETYQIAFAANGGVSGYKANFLFENGQLIQRQLEYYDLKLETPIVKLDRYGSLSGASKKVAGRASSETAATLLKRKREAQLVSTIRMVGKGDGVPYELVVSCEKPTAADLRRINSGEEFIGQGVSGELPRCIVRNLTLKDIFFVPINLPRKSFDALSNVNVARGIKLYRRFEEIGYDLIVSGSEGVAAYEAQFLLRMGSGPYLTRHLDFYNPKSKQRELQKTRY